MATLPIAPLGHQQYGQMRWHHSPSNKIDKPPRTSGSGGSASASAIATRTSGGSRTISLLLLLLTIFLIAHSIKGVADTLNTVYMAYQMGGSHPLRPLLLPLPIQAAMIVSMTILLKLILAWRRSNQVEKKKAVLFLLGLSIIPIYSSGYSILIQFSPSNFSLDYALANPTVLLFNIATLVVYLLDTITGLAILLAAHSLHRLETDRATLGDILSHLGRRSGILVLCFGIRTLAFGLWIIYMYTQSGYWSSEILRRIAVSTCLHTSLSMSVGIIMIVGAFILIRQLPAIRLQSLRMIGGYFFLIRGASSLVAVQWNMVRSSWGGPVPYPSLASSLVTLGYFTLAGVGVLQILLSGFLLRGIPGSRRHIIAATAIGLIIFATSACILWRPLNLLETSQITLDPPGGIYLPNQTITITTSVKGMELIQGKSNLVAALLLENTTQLDQGGGFIQEYDYQTITIREEVTDPSNATTPIQFRITIGDPGNYRAIITIYDCNRRQPVTGEEGMLETSGEHDRDWTMERVEFRVLDKNTTAMAGVGA